MEKRVIVLKNPEGKRRNVLLFTAPRQPGAARKPVRRANAEVYCSPITVTFYSFDQQYLQRLEENDAFTWAHFNSYFTRTLRPTLRSGLTSDDDIAEVLQDTFARVITAVRGGDIRQPSALGAYVHNTCKNVMKEFYRDRDRYSHVDIDTVEILDGNSDLELAMLRAENAKIVEDVLIEVPPRDRRLLRACYLECCDKDEVCRKFGIDRDYLRVLLLRSRESFRKKWEALQKRNLMSNGKAAH